jgi:hypothetical protein
MITKTVDETEELNFQGNLGTAFATRVMTTQAMSYIVPVSATKKTLKKVQ